MTWANLNDYQREGIAFEIAFFEGGLRVSPQNPAVLAGLAAAYTSMGRYEDGLVMDRMLVSLVPTDATVRYNLACSLSLTGRLDACIQELFKAIALGYSDLKHLIEDPDLQAVRGHPLWERVLELFTSRALGSHKREARNELMKPWADTLKQVDAPKPPQSDQDV